MYPPDGERKRWWEALKSALGTASSSFVNVSLLQLQSAARLPEGPLLEASMNAALAMIEAAAPQNEIEGALAVEMARTHCVAMSVLSRVHGCTQRSVSAYSAAAAKLLRVYTLQVEALRRLRSHGSQHVRVEHVHINDHRGASLVALAASSRRGATLVKTLPRCPCCAAPIVRRSRPKNL
jgi:hypothetical protein